LSARLEWVYMTEGRSSSAGASDLHLRSSWEQARWKIRALQMAGRGFQRWAKERPGRSCDVEAEAVLVVPRMIVLQWQDGFSSVRAGTDARAGTARRS
jgi:hypothetical protein